MADKSRVPASAMTAEQKAAAELATHSWYHGLLPREDIKCFLHENGDFLVRMSEPSEPGKRELVLSIMFNKDREAIKHFVINRDAEQKFGIEKKKFGSVSELVKYYLDTKTSITVNKEIIPRAPVGRASWELDHEDIVTTKKLGEGAFGEVHKGTWKPNKKKDKTLPTAIKLAKLDNLTKEQIKEIMREARLMREFDHPNVVRMYGVAASQEPLMIVMELASNGALDSYLKAVPCAMDKKLEMIAQAAFGLEYLHGKEILHRDIAARNCLYGDGNVKISDFGLSRKGVMYQMNPKNKVPIRWLAPETLRTAVYTQKTDVWSYGVMCWEIFHNGCEPYPGMTVMEMNMRVKDGYRMPLNDLELNPDVENLIVKRTWNENPNERFTMGDLSKFLEKLTRVPRPHAGAEGSKGGSYRNQSRSKK